MMTGGYYLLVTNITGITVEDPTTGDNITYPYQTNFLYGWTLINTDKENNQCSDEQLPNDIILQFQVS